MSTLPFTQSPLTTSHRTDDASRKEKGVARLADWASRLAVLGSLLFVGALIFGLI